MLERRIAALILAARSHGARGRLLKNAGNSSWAVNGEQGRRAFSARKKHARTHLATSKTMSPVSGRDLSTTVPP